MPISKRNHSGDLPRPKTTTGWTQCGNPLIQVEVTDSMVEDTGVRRIYNDGQRPYACSQCTTTTWHPATGEYTCLGTVWK